ncbi:MAG: hypothetical protein E6I21_06240, partial [Chloroflexi bacterium]
MSRARALVVAVVLVLFIAAGGMLIYANRGGGGKDVTISVTVTKGSVMTPSDLKAHQNDRVTFNVTSDTDGEVHLHGYDIHFDTK